MRGAVVVEEQPDFDRWVASHPTWSETQAATGGNATVGAAQYAVCAACHGQQGEGLLALNAPKIPGQGGWYLKNQIKGYKTGLRCAHENDIYGKQMAPMANILATDEAIDNVIAHIRTLPDRAPPATIEGNVESGAKTFSVCAYCHGGDGRGIQAMNAPRLAGMTDWYLKRQLGNFRDGVRGAHRRDYYGVQMGLVGSILTDDQKVDDVVAYINTL
jgi:cytochrome c oxidase subunit 2